MSYSYKPKPCRRCGGDKFADGNSGHPWYCAPCAIDARRDFYLKEFPWWCKQCDSPHYCVTCQRIKRERFRTACAERKKNRTSKYFRPINCERWFQQRCHSLVQTAIQRGLLPNLKEGKHACVDCGGVAHEYDHRDYGRPFDVDPVCRSCNKRRGTAKWPEKRDFPLVHATDKAA